MTRKDVRRKPGEPDRTPSPDAELTRSFAIGCGVLLLAFVVLAVVLYFVWIR